MNFSSNNAEVCLFSFVVETNKLLLLTSTNLICVLALGIECKVSRMLGKHFATELCSQP